VHVATFVFAIVYLGAATALGSFLVDGLRGDDHWPRPVSALAGFLPGYLMLLPPLQLLYAAFPLQVATWIALLGLPAFVAVLHRRALVETARSLRHGRARGRIVISTVIVVTVVAAAAVHRLQAGNYFLMQDSLLWWIVAGAQQVQGRFGSHLLQWNQQTDEWIFGAPLLFRSYSGRGAFTSLYAMQCLGLASFACLVFGIVHRLASRRKALAACVAVGVVLASTPLIYPWRYITIIGGDNPMLWTGQAGRQIGIVAPWAALLLISRLQRRATVIAAGFATAGLAFTSVNNVLYVVIAVGLGLAWRLRAGDGRTWMRWLNLRGVGFLLPVAAFVMILGAFWWLGQTWAPTGAVWWLIASAALAVAGAVAIGLGTAGRGAVGLPKLSPGWIGAWVATLAGGFMLSNNATASVFGGGLRHLLGVVFPGYGGGLAHRSDLGGDIFGDLAFPTFSPAACELFSYCDGLDGFLTSFGFLLVVSLATWLALGRMTTEPTVNARRVALLLMVASMAMTFMVMFFTGAEIRVRPMVFSRLLDVPYYGLLVLAVMSFAASRNRATMIAGTGVLVIWSVVPLIASQWPEQMARNSAWLVSHTGLF
jgi:hypothetical protein